MTSYIWRLNQWMARFMPDAFALAVLLSLGVMTLAKILTPASWGQIIDGWGDGFWALLSFAMQMTLMMMTGFIISDSPLVRRALHRFTALAADSRAACTLMAFSSMALCWIHWGLGMAASAVLVRYFALRHNQVHYPLLVASGYLGMGTVWHAGLAGSAPILLATPGHFMEAQLGVIPLSRTIFTAWNLVTVIVMIAVMTVLIWLIYPKPGEAVALCPEATLDRFHEELVDLEDERERGRARGNTMKKNFAESLEQGYWINGIFAAAGFFYLARLALAGQWSLNLDRFNFIFLISAVALHPSLKSFLQSAQQNAHTVTGIILQFPLYAGMYGVIKSTDLSEQLSRAFLAVSTQASFPLAVYIYSGILNYFVPSGGSKWAIEAPYLLEAAQALQVPSHKMILAYAWGDMVTDLVQPFFCLPLLAAARMGFRDIMGYLTIAFAAALTVGVTAMLILGFI